MSVLNTDEENRRLQAAKIVLKHSKGWYMSKIKITFTEQQAFSLIMAASQTMDHDDTIENSFPDRGNRRAAHNAYNKLQDEYYKEKPPIKGAVREWKPYWTTGENMVI